MLLRYFHRFLLLIQPLYLLANHIRRPLQHLVEVHSISQQPVLILPRYGRETCILWTLETWGRILSKISRYLITPLFTSLPPTNKSSHSKTRRPKIGITILPCVRHTTVPFTNGPTHMTKRSPIPKGSTILVYYTLSSSGRSRQLHQISNRLRSRLRGRSFSPRWRWGRRILAPRAL